MNNPRIVTFLVVCIATQLSYCSGYRILALQTFGARSHYLNVQPIVKELADRGHDVTFISSFQEKEPNYKQIVVQREVKWESGFNLIDITNFTNTETVLCFIDGVIHATEFALNSESVQDFIKNDKSQFDLIIAEIFFQPALYMFAHKYKCPIVGFFTSYFSQSILLGMGSPLILSYMNHEYTRIGTEPSLPNKIENIYLSLYDAYIRYYYLMPQHQALAEKHFRNLPQPLPQLGDIERNFSAIFLNSHFSIDEIRPYVPGLIEVGGVHIQKPKQLPENLQTYLDDAKDGAIYFSMGSTVRSKDMAQEKLQMFNKAFGKLKQRVLWKWEEPTLKGKPDNVLIGKWMPQSDILAHPNIRLFITHGGVLGMQEAVYHGVPVIGIPIYGDQYYTINYMAKSGAGLQLYYNDITEEILHKSIESILYNSSFNERAKEMSFRFKDLPMSPMDKTIYWMEYVIRQKGAKFMRSPVLDMSLVEYYMLDVWGLFILFLIIIISTVYRLMKIFRQISELFKKRRNNNIISNKNKSQ